MSARIGNDTPYKKKDTIRKYVIAVIATIFTIESYRFLYKNMSIYGQKINEQNNNAMFTFLFLIIGIGLLSLSVSTIMINAQASSGSTSDGGISAKVIGVAQMGICVMGVESPCNGA